jgi:ribosome biogenesis protein Nip4
MIFRLPKCQELLQRISKAKNYSFANEEMNMVFGNPHSLSKLVKGDRQQSSAKGFSLGSQATIIVTTSTAQF